MQNSASTFTKRASAALFVRFHPKVQSFISDFELVIDHKDIFQTEQRYDKLSDKAHGFLPLECKVLKTEKEPMSFYQLTASNF